MTYHNNLDRWGQNTVDIVGRGQEFIAKPKDSKECKKWLISSLSNKIYNSVF